MGGYTFKEIAARSGFTDTQHFVRTFTRKTGEQPRTLIKGQDEA